MSRAFDPLYPWLEQLQEGDEVGVEYKLGAVLICKVLRVTPKGRLVANGAQFSRKTGKSYGGSMRLVQVSDEQRNKVARQKLAGEVKGLIQEFARFDGAAPARNKIDKASLEDLTSLRDALILVRDGKTRSR